MWISKIDLRCIKSFDEAHLNLSKGINVIIGSNNCGKSTILQSVLNLQKCQYSLESIRLLEKAASTSLQLNDLGKYAANQYFLEMQNSQSIGIETRINKETINKQYSRSNDEGVIAQDISALSEELGVLIINYEKNNIGMGFNLGTCLFPDHEPDNLIYPYLSKRKVTQFREVINKTETNAVTGDLAHLYPKVDRLTNPSLPAHKEYMEACKDILNFEITSTPSDAGKKAALIVNNQDSISIDSMGEGVSSLLGLIVDLCLAEEKVFLIEEPENDIHPRALKKLLKLIVDKSQKNQFLITTHSNIVLKYLGAQLSSKIFQVSMELIEKLPTSYVCEVENNPEERRGVLEDLGYEFFDIDLWSAWLILEESSAEKIIREYFVSWFIPELNGRLRTFSARSLNEVELKFDDFNRLFVFLNLQNIYKNRAWVIVDGGEQESKVIEKLKTTYRTNGWSEDSFLQFSQHDFESYYPDIFQEQVAKILSETDRQKKRTNKKELLKKVEAWINEDSEHAKEAFSNSASEVIEILKNISSKILN